MIALHERMWPPHFIRIDSIASIGAPTKKGNGETIRRVLMADDEFIDMSTFEVECVLHRPVQLLPAEPGTALLNRYSADADREAGIIRTPLIAWALCVDGHIRLVTAAGVNDDQAEPSEGFAVLLPSGQVSVGAVALYDSLERYMAAAECDPNA